MTLTAFSAETIYTPHPVSDGVVVIEDGRILRAGPREEITLPRNIREVTVQDGFITPGFIDIHNHGAGGRDVMEATAEALEVVRRTLARFGTTSFYPTTITAPQADIRRSVEFLAGLIADAEKTSLPLAQPLGIHMEGPYLNAKRRGVHPTEHLLEPAIESYRVFAEAAKGRLRIMTIAPELPRAPALIEEMVRSGVQPSIGHTDSVYEEAGRAVEMGVRQATHMFNAMRPFGHRDPGVIAKVLTDSRVTAELIADGVHVDPKAMELLYHAKGPDGIVLISDGISAVGMPDGAYSVGGLQVVVQGGVCRYEGRLAGSVLTLDRAVRNMRDLVGLKLEEAIRMATLNPARLMGVEDRKGCLKPGADADLVLFGENLRVRQVYARGQLVK